MVIALDANWAALEEPLRERLAKWIAQQRGGLIVEAGDVYTPLLAENSAQLQSILDLYPVELSKRYFLETSDVQSSQPWPTELTGSGQTAAFLQLSDDVDQAAAAWQRFPGFYRTFPTRAAKQLADVYALFTDPRAQADGSPVLMASQQFGGGRVLYLGSPELWRLRSLDENYFNTFWTKAIREVGQGRLRQGDGPGLFLMERESYLLGDTVRLKARLSTPQGDPLIENGVRLYVTNPSGRLLQPSGEELTPEAGQPGMYSSTFRAVIPGRYQARIEVPGFEIALKTEVEVSLPQLEQSSPEQNRALLVQLAEETNGKYLTLDECVVQLPQLFRASAADSVPIDERLRHLVGSNLAVVSAGGPVRLRVVMSKVAEIGIESLLLEHWPS